MKTKKKIIVVVYTCLFLISIVLIVIPIMMSTWYFSNTLQNLPDWGVTKQHITMYLMGSDSYKTESQALAGSHLHLEAWHGYQEVMYRKQVAPQSVKFRFFLKDNSWIALIFNRPRTYAYEEENCYALRLSTRQDKPSALLQVDALGKFTDRIPIDTNGAILNNIWNTCTVRWKNDTGNIEVKLNDTSLGIFDGDYINKQFIGFRGGVNTAIVDDVLITEGSGEKHFSSFNWYEGLNRNRIIYDSIFMGVKIAFLIVLIICIIYLFTRNIRTATALMLSCCFTAILVIWPCVLYRISFLAPRYPLETTMLLKTENQLVKNGIDGLKISINQMYPDDSEFPEDTVVLIGSSQTWGSGAALRKQTWANKLETMLNEVELPQQTLFINGAVCGATSKHLYPLYENFLEKFPHKLLVIVLGCNDSDEAIFEENLIRFINFARSKQVKPALVIEALSYENVAAGTCMAPVMKKVAEKYNVPLFNMHEAVRKYQDAGFFWWDSVHPTSFGHGCIAHVLAPFFRECLETTQTQ